MAGIFHLCQGVSLLVAKYSNVTGYPLKMALSKASRESSSLHIWVSQYSLGEAQDIYYGLRVTEEEEDMMWLKVCVGLGMTFFTVESFCLALVTITTFISVQKHYCVEAYGTLTVMVQNPVLRSIIHVKHEAATKGAHVADIKMSKPMAG